MARIKMFGNGRKRFVCRNETYLFVEIRFIYCRELYYNPLHSYPKKKISVLEEQHELISNWTLGKSQPWWRGMTSFSNGTNKGNAVASRSTSILKDEWVQGWWVLFPLVGNLLKSALSHWNFSQKDCFLWVRDGQSGFQKKIIKNKGTKNLSAFKRSVGLNKMPCPCGKYNSRCLGDVKKKKTNKTCKSVTASPLHNRRIGFNVWYIQRGKTSCSNTTS